MKKAILLFKTLFLLMGTQHLYAAPSRLVIKTQVSDGVVALRWAPNNYALWRTWHTSGYQLERHTIQSNSTTENGLGPITKNIKPFEDAQLKKYIDTHPTAQLISSCLSDIDKPQSASELIKQIDRNEQCYIYSMLALQKDFDLTIAYGLGSIDSNAARNSIYLYKLYPIGGTSKDTQYCLVNTGTPSRQPSINNFKTFVKHNRIAMEWPAQLYQNTYFAYQIERSIDSGQTFESLSDLPILPSISDSNLLMPTYFTDTIAHYQQWLLYRIRGINYFGQLSLPSETDTLLALYETSAFPSSVNIDFPAPNTLHIEWNFSPTEEANIIGFKLSICDSSEGIYTPIDSILIQASKRSVNFNIGKANFYLRVNAITLNNQLNPSFQTMAQQVDSFPPEAPHLNDYTIDSSGHLEIRWHKPKTPDCMAYRVYFSNTRFTEFAVVTPHYLNDTIFRDTVDLKMLRDSIYFKVTSIDERYNESAPCNILAITLPNMIPPAAPVIYAIENSDNALKIKWYPSNSDGITQYRLNTMDHTNNIETEKILSLQDTTYTDSTLLEGHKYSFTLYAKKQNGLWSTTAQPTFITRPFNPWMPAIESVVSTIDSVKNRVDLFWQYRYDQDVKHYRIIAYDADDKAHTIGNAEQGNTYFSYNYLKPYTMKKYIIIAYFKDGRRSRI
jgi:fibronectin type 3 domain-containing protein